MYSSSNIIRMYNEHEINEHPACMRDTRTAYKILIGKLNEEELDRPRYRWKNDIKMLS
jgi:hypothetical protein